MNHNFKYLYNLQVHNDSTFSFMTQLPEKARQPLMESLSLPGLSLNPAQLSLLAKAKE